MTSKGTKIVCEDLCILDYQDYDTYDISGLFYNVTKIDEKCIFELSYDDDKCDLHLEANLEKDNFGLKVKSRKENGKTYVSLMVYYNISETIHKDNVKKMFNNWAQEIYYEYKCMTESYNKEYELMMQDEMNVLKSRL